MLITITAKEGNKIIEQFEVDTLSWGKWIAQDSGGSYYMFATKPVIGNELSVFWKITSAWYSCVNNGIPNPDWRDSLIDVSKIK